MQPLVYNLKISQVFKPQDKHNASSFSNKSANETLLVALAKIHIRFECAKKTEKFFAKEKIQPQIEISAKDIANRTPYISG